MILDVIIPIYNNEHTIEDNYKKIENDLTNIKHNYIFVNDGSTDNTLEMLKKLYSQNEQIKIINLVHKYGKNNAILEGLNYSKNNALIIDLSNNEGINHINALIKEFTKSNEYDCISLSYKKIKQNKIKKIINLLYDNEDENTTYNRILSKRAIRILKEYTKNNYFDLNTFKEIKFKTKYLEIRKLTQNKKINYMKNKYVTISLIVLFISLMLAITSLIINKSTILIISLLFLINSINIIYISIINSRNKKKLDKIMKKNIHLVISTIGIDEDIL